MKTLLKKIKRFLAKDVKSETETKDVAILMRVLSIFYFIYFLVFAPLLAFMNYYYLSFILLFAVGTSLACFILTYEEKTEVAVKIFYATVLIATSVLTVYIGWSANFQWNLLIIILLSYFNLDSSEDKIHRIKLIFVASIVITCVTLFFPVLRKPSETLLIVTQIFSTTFYISIVAVIAYLYSIKFNQSEEKLRQTNEKLFQMASVDALTQLPNRRSMNEHLASLVYEYERSGKEFCIAIGDVDHFKVVNDDYGHEIGDFILTSLADIFTDTMSGHGFVSRWGGEEFLFTFEGVSIQQAYSMLEVMRIRIDHTPFEYKGTNVHISMTFGLEEYTSLFSVESTISKADSKLYCGKNNGRNQVVMETI